MRDMLKKFAIAISIILVVISNLYVVYYLSNSSKKYTTIGVPGAPGKNGDSIKGDPGQNGKNGRDGMNGQNGIPGSNGQNGQNGIAGKDGVNGINGVDGKTPQFQCANNQIQWKYTDENVWNFLATADCTQLPSDGVGE